MADEIKYETTTHMRVSNAKKILYDASKALITLRKEIEAADAHQALLSLSDVERCVLRASTQLLNATDWSKPAMPDEGQE